MDISIKEALEALRPVAMQARAALKLSDVLGSLVGVENHRDELLKEVDGLKARVTEAEAKREKALDDGVEASLSAEAHARAIVTEAKDRAAVIAEECKQSVADATAKVAEIEADGSTKLRAVNEAHEGMAAEVAKLTASRDALVAEIDGLRERLKNLVG